MAARGQKPQQKTALSTKGPKHRQPPKTDNLHKIIALLQPNTTENTVDPPSTTQQRPTPTLARLSQTLQDGVRKGREQGLTRYLTALCYQWTQYGEPGIPPHLDLVLLPTGVTSQEASGKPELSPAQQYKEHSPSGVDFCSRLAVTRWHPRCSYPSVIRGNQLKGLSRIKFHVS